MRATINSYFCTIMSLSFSLLAIYFALFKQDATNGVLCLIAAILYSDHS